MNFDRFSEGIHDIQTDSYGYCFVCGEGITEYSQSVSGICEECLSITDEFEEE